MRTISLALFRLFILIPGLLVCKYYYRFLNHCIYLSSGVIYYVGKFTCPDQDAFDEYLNLRFTKFIAEALGWVFTIISLTCIVVIIKQIISWL